MHGDTLAIYGGTFNPVHNAHIEIALRCQEYFSFQRFHLLPSAQPDYKSQPIAAKHRVAMLGVAFAAHQSFVIDTREIERGGITYSIDTLREIRQQEGADTAIFFIMGSDSWLSFHTWQGWREILQLVNIIVVERAHYSLDQHGKQMPQDLIQILEYREVQQRHELLNSVYGKIFIYRLPLMDVSSTSIRQRIRQQLPTTDTLPEMVRAYIDEHHLYTTGEQLSQQH